MANPIVFNTVNRPGGSSARDALVTVELAGEGGRRQIGYDFDTDSVVEGLFQPRINAAGYWEVALTPNELIDPANTVWKISERVDDVITIHYVTVPDAPGPYNVGDILTDSPPSLPSPPLQIEIERAQTAEAALQANVDAEAVDRAAADAALHLEVVAEAVARAAADAAKQPLNADLTSISSQANTAFGLALLTLTAAASLRGAADVYSVVETAAAIAAAVSTKADLTAVPAFYQTYFASLVVTSQYLTDLAVESGYVYVVVDQNGRIALGVQIDGTVVGKITLTDGILAVAKLDADLQSRVFATLPTESGYLWGIVDQTGRVAIAVGTDGRVTLRPSDASLPGSALTDASVTAAKLAADVPLVATMPTESGYTYAIVDQNGRVALAVTADGHVVATITLPDASVTLAKLAADITTLLPTAVAVESGYTYAIVDQNGRVALAITSEGHVAASLDVESVEIAKSATPVLGGTTVIEPYVDSNDVWQLRANNSDGTRILLTAAATDSIDPEPLGATNVAFRRSNGSGIYTPYWVPVAGGAAHPLLPGDALSWWGDSLTAGAGGTPPPTALAALSGRSVFNGGIGGESSVSIAARQGGAPLTMTFAGGQIPASGGVTVTLSTPVLLQGPAYLDGTAAGVHGRLTYNAGVYTFTRDTAGSVVVTGPATFTMDISTDHENDPQILWLGRNNSGALSTVLANIAACATFLKTYVKRYLVLSVLNGAGEGTSTGAYTSITTLNNNLAATYDANHYIDIRAYLIASGLAAAGITPTGQDNTDIANDIVPTSLRSDTIHLNTAGYTVVAGRVFDFCTSKGWFLQ